MRLIFNIDFTKEKLQSESHYDNLLVEDFAMNYYWNSEVHYIIKLIQFILINTLLYIDHILNYNQKQILIVYNLLYIWIKKKFYLTVIIYELFNQIEILILTSII